MIRFICSPYLTAVLIVLIAAFWINESNADEYPTPIEPPTCEINEEYECV